LRVGSNNRYWPVNLILFIATLTTTTVYGAAVAACFAAGQPLNFEVVWSAWQALFQGNWHILQGLSFSVPLLAILLAHEFGHYVASRRWHVEASLPFFLPSPALLGTFGAFIRIRSPILYRKALFDIGVSGPVAGFLLLVPVLLSGIALSKVVPGVGGSGDFVFGTPLLIRVAEWIWFPGARAEDVFLHPLAQAASAGLLATAINLLPIGQLDGGHILYAVFGPIHNVWSKVFLAALLPLGYFSYSWFVWALLLFLLGTRHPLVYDDSSLNGVRKCVAAGAFAILVLSLSLTPVRMR
jgi:membrane-associated protease RseP (regulator of RpoE activity)